MCFLSISLWFDIIIILFVPACNCHRHSFDCYYDNDVDERRESIDINGHHRGGGVCLNCQVTNTSISCNTVCLYNIQPKLSNLYIVNLVGLFESKQNMTQSLVANYSHDEITVVSSFPSQHYTTGVNCERCIPTYYRSPEHPVHSPLACSRELHILWHFCYVQDQMLSWYIHH